jgi:DNA-binding XRE family transcriptional regulator
VIPELIAQAVQHRRELGLKQDDVARAMKTTQSHVSDIEVGRVVPGWGVLERYLAAVNMRMVAVAATSVGHGKCTSKNATPRGVVVQCQLGDGHEFHACGMDVWYSGDGDELIHSRTPLGKFMAKEAVGDLEDRLRATGI